jgi:molybdopterin-guanine dinucleotide biosynthesis protein A
MGLPKVTLPFGPEAMIHRVLRLLSEAVEPLVVVAAPRQKLPELPGEVILAYDQRERCGPLEGIRVGLSTIEGLAEAAYVTGCDAPLLVPALVRHLVERLEGHQVVVPTDGDFHHPLAAVYRTDTVPEIESLLGEGRRRPTDLYEAVEVCRLPVSQLRTIDPELQSFANLNWPEDYFSSLRRAGFDVSPEIRAAFDR